MGTLTALTMDLNCLEIVQLQWS